MHTILNAPDDFLRTVFDVNVLSNWYTTKAFLPDMLRNNKGHIVTIASTASFVGVAGMGDYTATKAAILAFHECLSPTRVLLYLHKMLTRPQRSTKSSSTITTVQRCSPHQSTQIGCAHRS